MKIKFTLTLEAVAILLQVVVCLVVLFVLTQLTVYFLPDYVGRDFFADKFYHLDYERFPSTHFGIAVLVLSCWVGSRPCENWITVF